MSSLASTFVLWSEKTLRCPQTCLDHCRPQNLEQPWKCRKPARKRSKILCSTAPQTWGPPDPGPDSVAPGQTQWTALIYILVFSSSCSCVDQKELEICSEVQIFRCSGVQMFTSFCFSGWNWKFLSDVSEEQQTGYLWSETHTHFKSDRSGFYFLFPPIV